MKLGTLNITTQQAQTPRTNIGSGAKVAESIGDLASVGMAAYDKKLAEDKAEEDAEYKIGVQLSNKHNQVVMKSKHDKAIFDAGSELSEYEATILAQPNVSPDQIPEGVEYDKYEVTINPETGIPGRELRDSIPIHEVRSQMFNAMAGDIEKKYGSGMGLTGSRSGYQNMFKDYAKRQGVKYKIDDMKESIIHIQNQKEADSMSALDARNYPLAVLRIQQMDIPDYEIAAKILVVERTAETDTNADAIMRKDIAEMKRLRNMYIGIGGVSSGRLVAIKEIIGSKEAGSKGYDSQNISRLPWSPDPDFDVSNATIDEVIDFQIEWGNNQLNDPEYKRIFKGKKTSSAIGYYQIVGSTLRDAVKSMGLKGDEIFNQELQDRIFEEYLLRGKNPAIAEYMDSDSPTQSQEKSAYDALSEWEAFDLNVSPEERMDIVRSLRKPVDENGMPSEEIGSSLTAEDQLDEVERLNRGIATAESAQAGKRKAVEIGLLNGARDLMASIERVEYMDETVLSSTSRKIRAAGAHSKEAAELSLRFDRLISLRPQIGFIATHSAADGEKLILDLKSKMKNTAENVDKLETLKKIHTNHVRNVNTNPHLALVSSKLIDAGEIPNIDLLNMSPGEISAGIPILAGIADDITGIFDVKDPPIFPKESADYHAAILDSDASPSKKMTLVTNLIKGAPNHAQKILNRLSESHGNQYYHIGLMSLNGNVKEAALALRGAVLSDNPDYKNVQFDADIHSAILTKYGTVATSMQNVINGKFQLAKSMYLANIVEYGKPLDLFQNDVAIDVIDMLDDNVIQFGAEDRFKLIAPKGVTEDWYHSYFKEAGALQIADYGGIRGFSSVGKLDSFMELLDEGIYRAKQMGDNRIRFINAKTFEPRFVSDGSKVFEMPIVPDDYSKYLIKTRDIDTRTPLERITELQQELAAEASKEAADRAKGIEDRRMIEESAKAEKKRIAERFYGGGV